MEVPAIHGKKVFFVQPNSVIKKEMVAELIRQEYEVLLVADAAQATQLFRRHSDCLAFLNIDEGLCEKEWEAFVGEVQADPALSGVKLGILTYNKDPELARRYLMEHMVPCGFIKLTLGLAESTAIVSKVLEANEAKGRRQFLRVHCGENTKFNVVLASGLAEGRILDISSVGMACTFDNIVPLELHSVLKSVQLQLKGARCMLDAVVMGSRPLDNGSGRAYILLFDPQTPAVQKEKIRAYLQWALQASIETEMTA